MKKFIVTLINDHSRFYYFSSHHYKNKQRRIIQRKEMTKNIDDIVNLRQDSPGDIGTCHQTTSFLFEPVLRIHVTPEQPGSTSPYWWTKIRCKLPSVRSFLVAEWKWLTPLTYKRRIIVILLCDIEMIYTYIFLWTFKPYKGRY